MFQGTFQVSESLNWVSFASTDGCEFSFAHSFEGKECEVEVSCSNDDSIVAVQQLAIPINRTKIKWKQTNLGTQYEVYYRCHFEKLDSEKMTKQQKKQRGKAATRGSSQTNISIYYTGETSSNGDDPGIA